MPSLNFKKEFVPGIQSMLDKTYAKQTGIKPKTTTIRARRKRPIRKGDKLFLYSGLRTKYCRKLGESKCLKVEDISIQMIADRLYLITIDGTMLEESAITKLAHQDGFPDAETLITWFARNHGFPFDGQRIHMSNTYQRKYFCNKMVKNHGFSMKLESTQKTILVKQQDVESAKSDRYINELATKYNYGIQIVNPLFS